MYIANARRVDGVDPPDKAGAAGRIGANVVALGAVSLVTDISSEMVTAVLPLYFVVGLGLSPLAFGFLDGLYAGATALARLAGGHVADRFQRRKLVAGVGYGVSAGAKLGLLAAGGSVPLLGGVLVVDRAGKGLRTAPRDALISLSADPSAQGRAFGVHRAMDTVGAFLGPLVAFALLWATADAYDAVFVVSGCIAGLGVLLLLLFVRDQRDPVASKAAVSLRAAFTLMRGSAFRLICMAAAVLGLVTISDGFLYLLVQKRLDLDASYFPLLALGTAGGFLLLAVPFGRIADRVGRRWVFLGGHLALLIAYAVLLFGAADLAAVIVVLLLHGVFYAATDGVLMALAAPLLPENLRASGIALLQTGQAIARLVSSIGFGWLWTYLGTGSAVLAAIIALVAGLVVAVPLLRKGT